MIANKTILHKRQNDTEIEQLLVTVWPSTMGKAYTA